jgi:hypothetical protein
MTTRSLILAAEADVTAGAGNSTTVSNATVVRIFNDSGADNTITIQDPAGNYDHNGLTAAGSITMPSNQVEFIEKPASYTIHGSGDFRATKVGFTN